MIRVEGVVANASGGDTQHRDSGGHGYLCLQAAEVLIYSSRFPTCVGEDGVIDLREDAFGRKSEHGAGLDSRAE